MTDTKNDLSGWYVIFPDGGEWEAVRLDRDGHKTSLIEACLAQTFSASNDPRARICEAVENSATESVDYDTALAVAAAWDSDADIDACLVRRIITD